MFKIFINDGTKKIPEDDIFYIISKEGIFLKKKLGIIESIIPVNHIGILNNLEINSFVKLNIPKIPVMRFVEIVSFFKEVHNLYSSESIVLIYYNENSKKFKFHIPEQIVSFTSVDYITDIIENYNLIGDIHSHGTMSAFHSEVDESDEKEFDGIHITVGSLNNDPSISISSSIIVNGTRFIIQSEDYIQGILLNNDSKNFSFKESFENKFNKDWLSKVSQKNMENTFLFNFRDLEMYKRNSVNCSHLDDENFNPCVDCLFKDYKMELLLEEITSEDDNEPGEEKMKNNFRRK